MNVTVVIASYNYGDMVGEAIESAVIQRPVSRIVVVDDGSTDGSRDIYEAYLDDDIEVIDSQKPRGPAAARNAGIARAWDGTDVFAFLDADDYYRGLGDEMLASLVAPFAISARVGLVYGDSSRDNLRVYRRPYTPEALAAGDIIGGNVAVSRVALQAVGRFDETMQVAENYELALRVARKFAIIHVPECVVIERADGRSLRATQPHAAWEHFRQLARRKANVGP